MTGWIIAQCAMDSRPPSARRLCHVCVEAESTVRPASTFTGLSTGWIHRAHLVARGVQMISGVTYDAIDNAGLHIAVNGVADALDVDTVVVCAGQLPHRDLYDELLGRGVHAHLIGGASVAAELDAKRAIREGTELASSI